MDRNLSIGLVALLVIVRAKPAIDTMYYSQINAQNERRHQRLARWVHFPKGDPSGWPMEYHAA